MDIVDIGLLSELCFIGILFSYFFMVLIFLAVLAGYFSSNQASDTGPLISLKQGRYRGKYAMTSNGYHVAEYLGIPFAKAPVGDLRLADPEPVVERPEEMFDAKRIAPSCPQNSDFAFGNFESATRWNPPSDYTSEDCLYLNIWVPNGRTSDKTVMVWIYGGGFYSGTIAIDMYNGRTFASFGDVILVSINYRLGSLGFLSTGDDRILGNFGLMDQVQGLKWVRDNIHVFGGNPNKVTIFGESAGAISVRYHMLSPLSNDLFNRGILQSEASDILVFSDHEESKSYSQKLLKAVNCPDDENVLKCLRSVSVNEFLKFMYAKPTLSSFMPQRPLDMLDTMEGKEILIGTNKNEGTYFLLYQIPGMNLNDQVQGQSRQQVKDGLKTLLFQMTPEERQEILEYYSQGVDEKDSVRNREIIDEIYGDLNFICPSMVTASANIEAGGTTYLYYYTHRASNEQWPDWTGVMHGAEIEFVFGRPLNASLGFNRQERVFSERLIQYWTNFAKTGNPNNQGNSPWPKYTPEEREYLELSLHETKHKGGYRTDQCRFWKDFNSASQLHGHLSLLLVTLLALVSNYCR